MKAMRLADSGASSTCAGAYTGEVADAAVRKLVIAVVGRRRF